MAPARPFRFVLGEGVVVSVIIYLVYCILFLFYLFIINKLPEEANGSLFLLLEI
jgi:hypothetical protein